MAKMKIKNKRLVKKKNKKKDQELTRLGSALRTLGGIGGGAVGGLFGYPISGSSLGTSLGASLSKWLGSGDYEVSTNSIIQRASSTNSIPNMHKEGQTIVVRHKEFVCTISGKQNFTVVNSFNLNPGMANLFPWLSDVAENFQEYRIRGLVFHYIPSSGTAVSGTNAALGTVMIQTSYRSNDTQPVNKIEMLNEYWSSESIPSEPFCHPIECNPKENPFNIQYVRNGAVPAGDNQLLYDLGTTYIAVAGQQANDTDLGDLWVTYEIELKKPVVASNVSKALMAFGEFTGGTYTTTNIFNGTLVSSGNLAVVANTMTITFPRGVYGLFLLLVNLTGSGNLTAADLGAGGTTTNCYYYQPPNQPQSYIRNVLSGGTPQLNTGIRYDFIGISDPSVIASFTYPNFAGLTTANRCTYTVMYLSPPP